VFSFGPDAVSSPEHLRAVARRLVEAHRAGNKVVAVLPAPDGTTADVFGFAHQISERPDGREADMLRAACACIPVALCAMVVHDHGVEAISLEGLQAGIITDGTYGAATITRVEARRIQDALERNMIVLVAGSHGVSDGHEITSFGRRDAADETAAAVAAVLGGRRLAHGPVRGLGAAWRFSPKLLRVAPQARRRLARLRSGGAAAVVGRDARW
jgi:aspartate kinase